MTNHAIQIELKRSRICFILLGIYDVLAIIAVFMSNCNELYKIILFISSIVANYLIIKHIFTSTNHKIDILIHDMQVVSWENNQANLWQITQVTNSGFVLMLLHLKNTTRSRRIIPIFIDSIPYSQYRKLRSKILWKM